MGANLSLTIVQGHLGRDPETRYTNSGSRVCNFSVAVNRKFKEQENTSWYDVVTFDKTAELCQQYLKKGTEVTVVGSHQQRKWTDRDGQSRTSWELIAQTVNWHSNGRASDGDMSPHQTPMAHQQSEPISQPGPTITDDDIPF